MLPAALSGNVVLELASVMMRGPTGFVGSVLASWIQDDSEERSSPSNRVVVEG